MNERKCKPMENEFFYVLAIVILGIIAFGYFIKADGEKELKKDVSESI